LSGERCRTAALIIRVKAVQSGDFFANQAKDAITSPLDILTCAEVRAVRGGIMAVQRGRKKKARRAIPVGRRG
jgi:hypothetical protein